MFLDFIFKRKGKPHVLRRLHKLFHKLTVMNKHLPDVSKKHDLVLNDQKFNLGIEILRLRGKVSNTIDEFQYDKMTLEDAEANVIAFDKEFHALRLKMKDFLRRAR